MAKTRLSQATYVERGYGQVEPNHLSAQHTGQIYAQLPAAADIDVLENGQFVKYDYANKVVNFTGAGEWMMVFNEIKIYRDILGDADFAMKADDYVARVYSPANGVPGTEITLVDYSGVAKSPSEFEHDSTQNPLKVKLGRDIELMPANTKMVPRVIKTNVGDIFTTNTVMAETLALGDLLAPNASGILAAAAVDAAIKFEVVKVYTMPDGQKGVKLMRVA